MPDEIPPLPTEAADVMHHYRDYHATPGYPYVPEVTALLESRPGMSYVTGAKWLAPGIEPGYSWRYWLAVPGGSIQEEWFPWNSYYQRTGAGPAPAGAAVAPFPPEEEE
jgi:hypothetical protein